MKRSTVRKRCTHPTVRILGDEIRWCERCGAIRVGSYIIGARWRSPRLSRKKYLDAE